MDKEKGAAEKGGGIRTVLLFEWLLNFFCIAGVAALGCFGSLDSSAQSSEMGFPIYWQLSFWSFDELVALLCFSSNPHDVSIIVWEMREAS